MRSETLDQLLRLLHHLPRRRMRALVVLLPFSVIPGVIDLLSVAAIARLTGALVGSGLEDKIPGVHFFGGNPIDQSLWLILIFISLAWVSSLSKISLRYMQQRLTASIWLDLSSKVQSILLRQGLEYHLSRSTADLSVQLQSNIGRVSGQVVGPVLQLFAAVCSVVVISGGILWVGRWSAVVLVLFLCVGYMVCSAFVSPLLRGAFKRRMLAESQLLGTFLESLSSVKDIQLAGCEPLFENAFAAAGSRVRREMVSTDWLPDLPRALIEPFGITMIFAVGAVPAILSGDPERVKAILPFLATIAVACLRLTPPLQDAFRSLTQFRGGLPLLSSSLEVLDLPEGRPTIRTPGVPSPAGIFPRHSIRLQNVWYRYPSSEEWVLKGVSLNIPVGSRVALVGTTGSGKTTTANLLVGLLNPSRGTLEVDGIPVEGLDVPAWQANCAQVPQAITLLNGSVLENVAFGVASELADQHRVWEALEMAQLQDFVSELPHGLHTQVGENGLRLSGGQRQRLALARAFYRQAKFLVLDEATSALDNRTESEVIDALEVVGRRCTTVVIAHRLSTVQRCDRIYEFHRGEVKAYGSFNELKAQSASFRELAQLEGRIHL